MLQYLCFSARRLQMPPAHVYQGQHVFKDEGAVDTRSVFIAEMKCLAVDRPHQALLFSLQVESDPVAEASSVLIISFFQFNC